LALATRKIHAYVATGRAKHPAETTRKVGGEMKGLTSASGHEPL
jgi:hypothetical protein